MVKINFDIAVGLDFEVHQAVPRKKGQHVVEKRNFGLHIRFTSTVDGQLKSDLCFGSIPLDKGGAVAHRMRVEALSEPDTSPAEKRERADPDVISWRKTALKPLCSKARMRGAPVRTPAQCSVKHQASTLLLEAGAVTGCALQ
jgi:hypothetical protein